MKVSIVISKEDSQIFLAFNRKLSADETARLRELGFKVSRTQPTIGFTTSNSAGHTWFVPDHRAYRNYVSSLQEELDNGIGLEEVPIHPSYEPSDQNLKHNNFSYVTFTMTTKEFEDWIVFEPFKRVATAIALAFGRKRFGEKLVDVSVLPRREKPQAKILMAKGRVIQPEQNEVLGPDAQEPDEGGDIGAYNDYAAFEADIINQVEIQGELTTSDAQGILMIPEHETYIKSQFVESENPTQSLAMKVANEVLKRYIQKEYPSHPDEPLANEHGVYVAELAGDNYEEIEIPFPINAKFEAFIRIAKGSDKLYRFGLSSRKLTGDWSGYGFAPSMGSPTYADKREALEAAFKQLIQEQDEKIIKVIKAFAIEQGIELDQERVETTPIEKGVREQLTELGFSIPFTAQEAFDQGLKVIELVNRPNTLFLYLHTNFEEPFEEKKKEVDKALVGLKGKRTKEATDQKKALKVSLEPLAGALAKARSLLDQEQVVFYDELTALIKDRLNQLEIELAEDDLPGLFAVVTEGLTEGRVVEGYAYERLPEVLDDLIVQYADPITKERADIDSSNEVSNSHDEDVRNNELNDSSKSKSENARKQGIKIPPISIIVTASLNKEEKPDHTKGKVYAYWDSANDYIAELKEKGHPYAYYLVLFQDNKTIVGSFDLKLFHYPKLNNYLHDFHTAISRGKIASQNTEEDKQQAVELLERYDFGDQPEIADRESTPEHDLELLRELVWQTKHDDYKSVIKGKKHILLNKGGTVLAQLKSLSKEDILEGEYLREITLASFKGELRFRVIENDELEGIDQSGFQEGSFTPLTKEDYGKIKQALKDQSAKYIEINEEGYRLSHRRKDNAYGLIRIVELWQVIEANKESTVALELTPKDKLDILSEFSKWLKDQDPELYKVISPESKSFFTSWLKDVHPELLEKADSIWAEAEEIANLGILPIPKGDYYKFYERFIEHIGGKIGGRTKKASVDAFTVWLGENYPNLHEEDRAGIIEGYQVAIKVSRIVSKVRKPQPYSAIYNKLKELIPNLVELLEKGASYGKSKLDSDAMMDLNFDFLGKDDQGRYIIALSHYYKQNGDMIPDPDMEIRIDANQEIAEAMTYQDTYRFQQVYFEEDGKKMVYPELKKDLNIFLSQWLTNALDQKHKIILEAPDEEESDTAIEVPSDQSIESESDQDINKEDGKSEDSDTTGLVLLDKIIFGFSECSEKRDVEFTSWHEANNWLRTLDIPEGGGYCKTDFKVVYQDGEDYKGRLDLSPSDDNPHTTDNVIGDHIYSFLMWQVKVAQGFSPYENDKEDTDINEILEFFKQYDLGLSKERKSELDDKFKPKVPISNIRLQWTHAGKGGSSMNWSSVSYGHNEIWEKANRFVKYQLASASLESLNYELHWVNRSKLIGTLPLDEWDKKDYSPVSSLLSKSISKEILRDYQTRRIQPLLPIEDAKKVDSLSRDSNPKNGELRATWDNKDDRFIYDTRIEILKQAGWVTKKGLPDSTAKKSAELVFDELSPDVRYVIIDKWRRGKLILDSTEQLETITEKADFHPEPEMEVGYVGEPKLDEKDKDQLAQADQLISIKNTEPAITILADYLDQIKEGKNIRLLTEIIKRIEGAGVKGALRKRGYDDLSELVQSEPFLESLEINLWVLLPDEFKKVKKVNKVKWKPHPQDQGLQRIVASFAETNVLRPQLMGVYFEKGGITVTNGLVLLHLHSTHKVPDGIYCMTKKCFEQIQSYDKGTGLTKVDEKYVNYEKVIPTDQTHIATPDLLSLQTFLKTCLRSWILDKVKNAVAFKAGQVFIFLNAKMMAESLITMERLGHRELEIGVTNYNRAILITPIGEIKSEGGPESDYILVMPVLFEPFAEEEELKKGTLYYDLDTNLVVTAGIGTPLPVIGDGQSQDARRAASKEHKKTTRYDLNQQIEEYIRQQDKQNWVYDEEDKNFILQYTGSGGMATQGVEGKGILYEYYTPDEIVRLMWGLANKFGYMDGDVLEPAVGTGNFLKYAPPSAKVVGYEINPTAKRIAEILYPHATIHEGPFESIFFNGNIHLKDDFKSPLFDLVIGNPPYGVFSGKYAGMGEKKWTRANRYEEYFMTRGLDLLRPGGLLIFIIPSGFLQGDQSVIKQRIAAKVEAILDAYRIPDGIFPTTDIGTDILALKRK